MVEWWNSLNSMMKILWAITLSASLVFIIQSIMTFLGANSGSDFDVNADDFLALAEFVGREGRLGDHANRAFLGGDRGGGSGNGSGSGNGNQGGGGNPDPNGDDGME